MNSRANPRPDIFAYHDFHGFLKDWLAYLASPALKISLRKLAQKAGLATGYLPMILSRRRNLSLKALQRILPHLELKAPEQKYLERLFRMAARPAERAENYQSLQRFKAYKEKHASELEVYRYLTKWFYPVIREMAFFEGFKGDPLWVQSRLRSKVTLSEAKTALEFLKKKGFLVPEGGTLKPSEKSLKCVDGVFLLSLSQFHKQMLRIASESIDEVPSSERSIEGQTVAIAKKDLAQVRAILDDALNRIEQLSVAASSPDSVYHVTVAAVPLTNLSDNKELPHD